MATRLKGRYGYPTDDPFKVTFHPTRLAQPPKWKKPRRIFVVSMGDLYHWDVKSEWRDAIYEVIQNICDESGTPNMIQGVIYDITERKRMEEALKENKERYHRLFNNTNDIIFVHPLVSSGATEKFIEINDVTCQRLGYTREELLQRSPSTISEDPKEVKKNQIIIIPMQDGSLNIYPDGTRGVEKSETTLKLDKKHVQDNDYFQKRMIAKYLAGHQQIRLTSEDIIGPEIIKRTEEIVRMFIGCEIIEMSPNVLVIKDLLALGELSIEKALNMMNIIAFYGVAGSNRSKIPDTKSFAEIGIRIDSTNITYFIINYFRLRFCRNCYA